MRFWHVLREKIHPKGSRVDFSCFFDRCAARAMCVKHSKNLGKTMVFTHSEVFHITGVRARKNLQKCRPGTSKTFPERPKTTPKSTRNVPRRTKTNPERPQKQPDAQKVILELEKRAFGERLGTPTQKVPSEPDPPTRGS